MFGLQSVWQTTTRATQQHQQRTHHIANDDLTQRHQTTSTKALYRTRTTHRSDHCTKPPKQTKKENTKSKNAPNEPPHGLCSGRQHSADGEQSYRKHQHGSATVNITEFACLFVSFVCVSCGLNNSEQRGIVDNTNKATQQTDRKAVTLRQMSTNTLKPPFATNE